MGSVSIHRQNADSTHVWIGTIFVSSSLNVTHFFTSCVVRRLSKLAPLFKGEVYPEMKLCELLVLVHCIHLPLILFACASSGQSYNIDSPVVPNCCDVIDTAMTGDPIAF